MAVSFLERLPDIVRRRALSLGEPGEQWLQQLDDTMDALGQQWQLTLRDVLKGGSESLVVDATLADGTNVILKLGLTGSANLTQEARVYQLAGARGMANLIDLDEQRNALLLEKLGPSLASQHLSTNAQFRIICHALEQTWLPLEHSHGLMTGQEKAEWLYNFIEETWLSLDKPCLRSTVDSALAFCESRALAHTSASSVLVLVHGDAHEENTLLVEDGSSSYKLIDPDGLFAEKACDLAPMMRSWNEELLDGDTHSLMRQRAHYLAELTSVSEEAIWEWGYMERVSTGFVLLQVGSLDEARATLDIADRLSSSQFTAP